MTETTALFRSSLYPRQDAGETTEFLDDRMLTTRWVIGRPGKSVDGWGTSVKQWFVKATPEPSQKPEPQGQ